MRGFRGLACWILLSLCCGQEVGAQTLNGSTGSETKDGFDTPLPQLTFAVKGAEVGAWTPSFLSVTGAVRVGQSVDICSAAEAGAIRWNAAAVLFEGCNGTAWQALGAASTFYAATNTAVIYCPAGLRALSGGARCNNTISVGGANHAPSVRETAPILSDNTILAAASVSGVTNAIGWFVSCGVDQGSETVPSLIWVGCQ